MSKAGGRGRQEGAHLLLVRELALLVEERSQRLVVKVAAGALALLGEDLAGEILQDEAVLADLRGEAVEHVRLHRLVHRHVGLHRHPPSARGDSSGGGGSSVHRLARESTTVSHCVPAHEPQDARALVWVIQRALAGRHRRTANAEGYSVSRLSGEEQEGATRTGHGVQEATVVTPRVGRAGQISLKTLEFPGKLAW